MMAAEELGIAYDKVRAVVADTSSLGFNDVTEGSRVTFSTGLATIEAARDAIGKLCGRAAKIWGIPADAVVWENGRAKPSGPNAGTFEPLSLADIAKTAANTGGPIAGHFEVNADGAGVSFAVHIADAEVDRETGRVLIKRYTVVQDAGKAVHPSYVEGQYQGGAAQGIGWAINEEYIYGKDGRLQNAGFLDYRIPVGVGFADDRHGDCRGAQSGPPLRRARGRRNLDRAAVGGHRQCRVCRSRRAFDGAADVAAPRA